MLCHKLWLMSISSFKAHKQGEKELIYYFFFEKKSYINDSLRDKCARSLITLVRGLSYKVYLEKGAEYVSRLQI